MTVYFLQTADTDPLNSENWWDTPDTAGSNYQSTDGNDCVIVADKECSTSNFPYGTLVVEGILTTNESSVIANNGTITTNIGTVVDNNGTITTNTGTVETNNAVVVTNSGTIYYRQPGGSTTHEYENAIGIENGYAVDFLYSNAASVDADSVVHNIMAGGVVGSNLGTIGTVHVGGEITYNRGGVVSINRGTISHMLDGILSLNDTTGLLQNTASYAKVISNLGTVAIVSIGDGTGNLRANSSTNISQHTGGVNVTLPTGNTSWW